MSKIQNNYLRFFAKLLLVLSLVIVLDQITGAFLNKLYFTQTSGLFYRTTYVMDSTTADVVVFGSSRANHHYVPQIFEDSLKMSFYNAGRDGNFLLFNYATFLSLTKRYTPKVIIFDINNSDILKNETGYERLSSLLPYYRTHKEVRPIVELRNNFEKQKLLSAIYPYNSSLLTILVGNLEFNKKRKGDDKGYVPVYGEMTNQEIQHQVPQKIIFDTLAINYLKEIAFLCKKKEIKLYLVYSPIFYTQAYPKIDSVFNSIAQETGCKYYDFSQDTSFVQKGKYFKDIAHLNHKGATYFSNKFVSEIKHK